MNATLSSSSQYINLIDAESEYINLNTNEIGIGDGFIFQLSSDAVFGDDIELILNIEAVDNQWIF